MQFQRSEAATGGHHPDLSPMQIAHNPLFTTRERSRSLCASGPRCAARWRTSSMFGLSPAEIDEAIEEVKLSAQNGEGGGAVLRRDN